MAVSNKDVEVLSEAMFCYYFAIWKKGNDGKYDYSEWKNITTTSDLSKFTTKMGITSMVKKVVPTQLLLPDYLKYMSF